MKRKSIAELRLCLSLLNSQYDTLERLYQRQRETELNSEDSWSERYWQLKAHRERAGSMIEQVSTVILRRESRKAAV